MKYLISTLLVCATLSSVAQTNFVKNSGFEKDSLCPTEDSKIYYAKDWGNAVKKFAWGGAESFNECANSIPGAEVFSVPENAFFYGYAHGGKGLAGCGMYYDKTLPRPPLEVPLNAREYVQGSLYKNLKAGKEYCISVWLCLAESSGYAHNKIGVYLDDGKINSEVDSANKEILTLTPQIYTNTVIKDTMNWTKIEGSFVAKGNETYITIGNFFPNDSVSTEVTNYWFTLPQYSYYLIDDVSVVAIDSKANAGVDRWVELGKTTQIGPVEDSTARGMDCKWYYKGKLIDSGNVITVNASSIKYAVDTYVVVQNVCGNITRDTMLLKTVGLGMSEMNIENTFSIYPNPSNGNVSVSCFVISKESITAKVYDLLGRIVHQELLNFNNKEATLELNIPSGSYILELKDEAGNVQRERIVIN